MMPPAPKPEIRRKESCVVIADRFTPLACAAAVVLAIAGGPALADGGPGHGRLCDELAQRYRTMSPPVERRTLDFLLFDAAERGCDDLIRDFLAAGASPATRNGQGDTALTVAAPMGQTASAELLIANGAAIDR